VKSFFDAIARRYDRQYALSGATSRERLARMLRVIAGKRRVLDLGIGTGRELPALLDAGHDVTGLELSAEMIAEHDKRSRTVPMVRGDFYDHPLPFPDASFDAVIALHGTLAHPPRDDAHRTLASEIARVLADGGVFYAEVPAAEGLAKLGVRMTGPRSFVHRDDASGIEITGVARTKDEWRDAFAPLVVDVESMNDVEHAIHGTRANPGG
jgi:SAM-dependent methyltransferase